MDQNLLNFPPFYTKQLNNQVLQRQIAAWHSLILQKMSQDQRYLLDISSSLEQSPFKNQSISRSLSRKFLVEILDRLVEDESQGKWLKNGESCLVYWRKPREIAESMISTFGTGSICTVWEILHAHEWEEKPFWGIEQEMLLEVLRLMQAEGKIKIIGANSPLEYGIKFL